MAQPSKDIQEQNAQQGTTHTSAEEEKIGSPLTNEAYDVIAALKSKLEGLEAYRKYAKDANSELWKELTKSEIPIVERLVDELERMVKEGKLRLKEPGEAH